MIRRLAAVAAALGLALAGLGLGAWRSLRPVDPDAEPQRFSVPPGAGLSRVSRELARAGLVRNARAAEWLGRLRGMARDLRAGEYELSPALSTRETLDRIASGRVLTHEISLPEGLRASEIALRLERAGLAESAAFLAVVNSPDIARALGVEGDSLEGYLFPETYRVPRGLAPRALARVFVDQFLRAWQPIAPLAKQRGLSMAEVVTLASIIEKETGAAPERPLIASVFHNRLKRGMRLETDPTVIYAIPDFDGNLTRRHLQDASNPYNTYRRKGLPPGPIANPGADALRAAVEPADTDYLYFVSKNDGTHFFSSRYRDHVNAVNRFQKRRRSRSPRPR